MSVKITIESDSSCIRDLLALLEARFIKHPQRHPDTIWQSVREQIEKQPEKLWSLHRMEETGGEPDVIGFDRSQNEYYFMDCSPESPIGRRSLCFDEKALQERKENPPKGSAEGLAEEMGIQLLTEADYRHLQTLGPFDTKTSSWIQTPKAIRERGGALFGDCRYGAVFIYHNGAGSYYAARGFRGVLVV
ncbi:MAG: hypothetical protein RLZZ630_1163 [Bacteroidota bacterium]|jgi:hypothetical protein